jgi:hypothetical protein
MRWINDILDDCIVPDSKSMDWGGEGRSGVKEAVKPLVVSNPLALAWYMAKAQVQEYIPKDT